MVDIQHKDITGADAAHPPFYASESDPTTTLGAYRGWIKPSTGEVKVRNATNTDWIEIASGGGGGSEGTAWLPVRVVALFNVTMATPGSSFDGITISSGDSNKRILLTGQSTPSQNGIYDWNGAATPLTRATDADVASEFITGKLVGVISGDDFGGQIWQLYSEVTTLGSSSVSFREAIASGWIRDLQDVALTGLADGDVLIWNEVDGLWEPGIVSGGGSGVAVEEDGSEEGTGIDRFDFTTGLNLSVTGTQATVSGSDASETAKGIVELATDAETQTGIDTARAITPANLTARSATETRAGIAEVATQAETDTGTDDNRIVTPLKAATRYLAKAGGTLTGFLTLNADPTSALHAVTKQYADGLVAGGASPASETVAGIAEIATQAETNTGTDDTRIVTPLKLANYSGLGGGGATLTEVYAAQSSAVSISASTFTKMTFTTTGEVDALSEFDPTTGTFTAASTKRVHFVAYIAWASNSTGYRFARFYKNGSQTRFGLSMAPVNGDSSVLCLSAYLDLTSGDTVDIRGVNPSTSGSVSINSDTNLTTFEAHGVG